jgi:hypothetical protein
MANATTATPTMMSAAAPPSERVAPKRLFAFLIMVFGMFMSILDIQIVSASLSEIQAGLSASASEVSWVQTAYLIAEVIAIPLSGFLSRAFGTRLLFAISASGFTIASFLCGFASTIEQMILWRAIQGFLGAGMIPTVFASAYTVFPRSKFYIVGPIIGLVATLAPILVRRSAAYHRLDVVALAVLHQRRAGHRHHHRRPDTGRFRPAEFRAARPFRLVGPAVHGRLPRLARICARGGPAI